jgi:acyl-coenzyme A synthetase/AMP-(fatty) acid ligase
LEGEERAITYADLHRDVQLLANALKDLGVRKGDVVLKHPWPGMLRTLYEDDERYVKTYWSRFGPGTFLVGDAAIRDKEGYLRIVGGSTTSSTSPAIGSPRPRSSRRSSRTRRSPRRPSSHSQTSSPAKRSSRS